MFCKILIKEHINRYSGKQNKTKNWHGQMCLGIARLNKVEEIYLR